MKIRRSTILYVPSIAVLATNGVTIIMNLARAFVTGSPTYFEMPASMFLGWFIAFFLFPLAVAIYSGKLAQKEDDFQETFGEFPPFPFATSQDRMRIQAVVEKKIGQIQNPEERRAAADLVKKFRIPITAS